ncbi:MAG: hypothetical protein IJX36_04495, partial [Thermoguttaceae bacterium]|nr:hypothetical protein [Thermoguttaceae bacterium]
MAAKTRFNAVATVAAVAVFPVFPLFADEPTTAPDAAPQAVASADATAALERETAAFANFNVSLFEIPDGESVEFYRKRDAELQVEWSRYATLYMLKLEEAARASGAPKEFTTIAFRMFPGTIPTPLGFVDAPADSVPARYSAAQAATLRRLIDSPELPPEIRGRYYADWTVVAPGPLGERPLVALRDSYAKLLADEKAKSPLDLGRVRYLRERVDSIDQRIKYGSGILDCLETPLPFDLADVEKLLADRPQEESVELYRTRVQKLFAAEQRAREAEADYDVISKIRKTLESTSYLLREAERKAAAALDVAAVKQLLDVPQGESGAFYIERYNKAQETAYALRSYNNAGLCDLRDLEDRLFEALPTLARRVAYADDLNPLERFEYFTRWIDSCDVEELKAALEAETARDATSEIDEARRPFVEYRLLEARLKAAVREARKDLPEADRYRSTVLPETPLSPELETTFNELFDEIAERADDGALPWELGGTWGARASYLALCVESVGDEYATRLRKAVCAALADDEDETNRTHFKSFETAVRNAELKTRFDGFPVDVAGVLLDGTPFDWASYRGAPVLIEIVRVDLDGVPSSRRPLDVAMLDEYEKAGLRRVRYVVGTPERARQFAERVRLAANPNPNPTASTGSSDATLSPADAAEVAANLEKYLAYNDALPVVAPTTSAENWLPKLRADVDWVLVGADGKTLAAIPKRP